MKTLVLLLVSATLLTAQTARSTPGARVPAPATAAAPAPPRSAPPQHSAAPARPIATHPVLPVGWGLAPGPVSTVNHPGGVGRRGGALNPYSQTYIVGTTYPIAVYPQSQQYADNPPGDGGNSSSNYGNNYNDTQQPQQASYNYPAQYNEPVSNPAADVVYTLIAFKDHSIYAVVDYWLENNKLNYVTNYGASSSVALDKVDLPLTEQLNGDRNTKFELHEKQPGN